MAKTPSKFKTRLQAALDKFDVNRAEQLSDELHNAEADGYEFTAAEEKLWDRLTYCIETYRRNAALL